MSRTPTLYFGPISCVRRLKVYLNEHLLWSKEHSLKHYAYLRYIKLFSEGSVLQGGFA